MMTFKTATLCMTTLFAVTLLAQEKPAPPVEFHDIVYSTASGQKLELDVYQNANATAEKPAPVLLYYHGGAWAREERPKHNSFNTFLAMGFSVISVDYRETPVATAPAAVTDVLCSLSWVKANAEKYKFDAARVVPYGTSAGGHLALMGGMLPANTDIADPKCGPLPKVAAILDFYGPTDLPPGITMHNRSLMAWIGKVPDPMAMAKTMSPMTYVRAGLPPIFIVHGGSDPTVPHEQSVELHDALDAVKVPNVFYTVDGGGHGGFDADEKKKIFQMAHDFLVQQKVITQ